MILFFNMYCLILQTINGNCHIYRKTSNTLNCCDLLTPLKLIVIKKLKNCSIAYSNQQETTIVLERQRQLYVDEQ